MIFGQGMCIHWGVWKNNCARPLNIALALPNLTLISLIIICAIWQSDLARDRLSFIPCVEGRGVGNHQEQKLQSLEGFRTGHVSMNCRGLWPAQRRPNSAKPFILWIWHNWCSAEPCACAAPCAAVPVQCRPLRLCNAGPHARAMPIALSWVSHVGHTPPVLFTCHTSTTMSNAMQDMDAETHLRWRAISMQTIHRAGGN